MSSHTVTSPSIGPDSGSAGTRQPAFLRPLPGQRLEPIGGDSHARAGSEVLDRLFPRDATGDSIGGPPGAVAGVRLGHFVIEERIGHGGMGSVFRAVDERLNRVVALKVLAPGQARDTASVERFRNEAQAAARLDHENISRVYYIGDDQGVPFIAFEFVRGTNVRDIILQKGVLSPAESVNYALQIAQALRHTQAAGVVHRDIKPSNIIITPAGHAKLVDLGLARQEQLDPARELTVPGTTLGTFDYIAPEQARDPRCVDVRADIYSLGCTLYHMLTGQPPFPQGTIIQKVVDHHRDAPPDPAERNPHVPPALSQIVRKMMASNPDERYAGPDQLVQELSQVAGALGLRAVHADNLVWIHPLYPSRPGFFDQNKGWLITLAALVLFALSIDKFSIGPLAGRDDLNAGASAAPQSGSVTVAAPGAPPDDRPADLEQTRVVPRHGPAPQKASGLRDGLADSASPTRISSEARTVVSSPLAPPAAEDPMDSRHEAPPNLPFGSAPIDTSVVREIEQFTAPVPVGGAPSTEIRPDPQVTVPLPFVVMDEENRTETGFATLDQACERAESGGLIELRFNGRPPLRQPPVRIQHKRLTIRAQNGRRPSIEFDPRGVSGQTGANRIFQVAGGELRLQNVELVMSVPSGDSDGCALFSLAQVERFALDGVSLVVANPERHPATVVELVRPPGLDTEDMMPESMRHELVELDWRDCLIRGECDLLTAGTLDPTDLHCEDVAVAVRGAFLRVHGDLSTDGPLGSDRRLSMVLQHVTALLHDGLIRIDTGYDIDREFLPIDVQTHDSALIVRSRQPLVSVSANQDMETLKRRLRWQSSWSAFDVTGPVWEIKQELEGNHQQLDFMALNIVPQVVENDLLQQPIDWNNLRFTTLKEAAFRLRPPPPQSTRNSATGVQVGDRFPASDTFAAKAGTTDSETLP